MTWISYINLTFFFVLLLSLFKKNTDIYSPGRLFAMIWTLAIGLTDLKFSRYQFEWSSFSWYIVILSIASFLIGVYINYVLNLNKKIKSIKYIRGYLRGNSINSEILFRYTIFLFIAYIISYIVCWVVIGYVPIFTKFPALARNDWGLFGFGLFVQSFPTIIFFIVLYFTVTREEKFKKFTLGILFVTTFVTYSLLLQRYYIVFAILLSLVTLYYSSRVLRFRNVMIISIILLSIFFGMSYVRLGHLALNFLYYLSEMKFSVDYAIFTEPYMYVAMNLENFANAVNHLEKFTYGLFTADFVFALSGLKHAMTEYLHLAEFPHMITKSYNTYTMFFVYYRDFGIMGIAVLPFVIGFYFSDAYYKMRQNPNIHTVSIYGIFTFVILFSFFVPVLTFLHFAFNFVVIYFTTKQITLNQKI